jgi:hypothetical protein
VQLVRGYGNCVSPTRILFLPSHSTPHTFSQTGAPEKYSSCCSFVCIPDSKVCCHLCIVLYYASHVFMLLFPDENTFQDFDTQKKDSKTAACVVEGKRKGKRELGRFLSGLGKVSSQHNFILFETLPFCLTFIFSIYLSSGSHM